MRGSAFAQVSTLLVAQTYLANFYAWDIDAKPPPTGERPRRAPLSRCRSHPASVLGHATAAIWRTAWS